jgi:hypothetical protein
MPFEYWLNWLTALGALVAAVAALWQARGLKISLRVETLGRLIDRLDSIEYQDKRKKAAESCLTNLESRNPAVEVEDVLDFLEDVAFFVHTGALTPKAAWHGFYHWIRGYCQASERYIAERQSAEPEVYKELLWLYPKLNRLERASQDLQRQID